jgi:hypothetical protein
VAKAQPPQPPNPPKQVEVLWVINAQIREWEKALPIESQDLIDDNRRGQPPKLSDRLAGLKAFPYVSTFQADYSPVRACFAMLAPAGTRFAFWSCSAPPSSR